MKTLTRLALGLALATSAFAQGGFVRVSAPADFLNYSATTYLVGTAAASGTPISPTASIYSDKGLTSSISQSSAIVLPSRGFIEFYAQPGIYQVQWNSGSTGPGAFTQVITVPADGNPTSNTGLAASAFDVPPSMCYTTVSGNSTGTNGYTVSGASNMPVVQAQTSNSGTNTHTYICTITAPTALLAGKGITINDVTFYYGVQTTALGTQNANNFTLATVTLPAAGSSETPSTVTPVSAGGSLTLLPLVGSFNTATTTAGAFYSEKISLGTPVALATDLTRLVLTITLQCAATSATVTNSPGLIVHYSNVPM